MRVLHFQHMGVGVILAEQQRLAGIEATVLASAPHPFGFVEDAVLPVRAGVLAKPLRLLDWSRYYGYDIFHNHDNCYVPAAARLRWRHAFVQHYHDASIQAPIADADVNFVSLPSLCRYVPDAVWVPLPARTSMFVPRESTRTGPVRVGYSAQATDPQKPNLIPVEAVLEAVRRCGSAAEANPIEGLWNQADMPRYYAEIDIWVDRIGCDFYGFSAIEAASMGIPVITQIGSAERDFVPDCPFVDTPWDGVERVLWELLNDPVTREQLGKQARSFVVETHDAAKVAALTIEYYRRLMEGSSR